MKTLMNLAIAATLLTALPAWACTPEEATAKREQLGQEVAKLTEQNSACRTAANTRRSRPSSACRWIRNFPAT